MICGRCGRAVANDLDFCPHCGFKFKEPPIKAAPHALGPSEQRPPAIESRSTLTLVISVVVLLVVLPIALSALIYFAVLGFGDDTNPPPDSLLQTTQTARGYSFSFSAMSQSINWNDLEILLDSITWNVVAGQLDNGAGSRADLGENHLGQLSVWCNVTDLVGNGRADNGDFFTLETGSSPSFVGTGTHSVTVLYEPAAESLCSASFTA